MNKDLIRATTRLEYEANPLEYLGARLMACQPPGIGREIDAILVRMAAFLSDPEFPAAYISSAFEQIGQDWDRLAGRADAQINVCFALNVLDGIHPAASEVIARLRTGDLWQTSMQAYNTYRKEMQGTEEATRDRPFPWFTPAGKKMGFSAVLLSKGESARRSAAQDKLGDAKRHALAGDFQASESSYAESIALWDPNEGERYDRVQYLLQSSQFQESIALLASLETEFPKSALYKASLGAALLAESRLEESVEMLDAALRIEPNRRTTIINKAIALCEMRRFSDASDLLVAVLDGSEEESLSDLNQEALTARLAECAGHMLRLRPEMAQRLMEHACRICPDEPLFWSLSGAAHHALGDSEGAAELYDHTLRLDPTYQAVLLPRARLASNEGELYRAIDLFESHLDSSPDDGRAWNDLGVCYARVGDMSRAAICHRRAVDIEPGHPLHQTNMGNAIVELGEGSPAYEAAMVHFQSAIAIDPNFAQAHYGLGIVYYLRDDSHAARIEFLRACQIDPDHAEARRLAEECRYPDSSEDDDSRGADGQC